MEGLPTPPNSQVSKISKKRKIKPEAGADGTGRKRKRYNISNLNSLGYSTTTANNAVVSPNELALQVNPTTRRNFFIQQKVKAAGAYKDITQKEFKEACRAFVGRSIMPDQDAQERGEPGVWRLKGMTRSLHDHQLLAAAHLRRLEENTIENFESPIGGILADEKGFGKTAIMLANIQGHKLTSKVAKKSTTLIVVPSTLRDQWIAEVCKFFGEDSLSVHKYTSSITDSDDYQIRCMRKSNIVLATTFQLRNSIPSDEDRPEDDGSLDSTIKLGEWAARFEKAKGLLLKFEFDRVVLEEAHAYICNPNTRTFKACFAVKAKFHWAITGTVLKNGENEIYPYLKFIGVPNCATLRDYKRTYCEDREVRDSLLAKIMVRRTHDNTILGRRIVNLPERELTDIPVHMTLVETSLYLHLQEVVDRKLSILSKRREQLLKLAELSGPKSKGSKEGAKEANSLRQQVFALVLRLRQYVSCPLLTVHYLSKTLSTGDRHQLVKESSEGMHIGENAKNRMRKLLQDPKYTCKAGESRHHSNKTEKNKVTDATRKKKKSLVFSTRKWLEICGFMPLFAKLRAAQEKLQEWISSDQNGPAVKIVIFTQFVETLHMLEAICDSNGWGHRPYHGGMLNASKTKSLEEWSTEEDITILLMTFKSGGVGLNLQAGSRVLLLDPWWNSAEEDQAFSRVYRIGQNNKCIFARLLIADTIDERMVAIQQKKEKEIRAIMNGVKEKKMKLSDEELIFIAGSGRAPKPAGILPNASGSDFDSILDDDEALSDSEDQDSESEASESSDDENIDSDTDLSPNSDTDTYLDTNSNHKSGMDDGIGDINSNESFDNDDYDEYDDHRDGSDDGYSDDEIKSEHY